MSLSSPRTTRVKTQDGWSDLAIQGPAGPPGPRVVFDTTEIGGDGRGWYVENPVVPRGVIVYLPSGGSRSQLRVGDGTTRFVELPMVGLEVPAG